MTMAGRGRAAQGTGVRRVEHCHSWGRKPSERPLGRGRRGRELHHPTAHGGHRLHEEVFSKIADLAREKQSYAERRANSSCLFPGSVLLRSATSIKAELLLTSRDLIRTCTKPPKVHTSTLRPFARQLPPGAMYSGRREAAARRHAEPLESRPRIARGGSAELSRTGWTASRKMPRKMGHLRPALAFAVVRKPALDLLVVGSIPTRPTTNTV